MAPATTVSTPAFDSKQTAINAVSDLMFEFYSLTHKVGETTMQTSAYQILLAARISQTGKKVAQLTVGELITIIDDCSAEYNARATA